MNIIEAVKQMDTKKRMISEFGFAAVMDEENMLMCENCDEPFAFYGEELLSDKWEVVDKIAE
jgi:hypothetical protein